MNRSKSTHANTIVTLKTTYIFDRFLIGIHVPKECTGLTLSGATQLS